MSQLALALAPIAAVAQTAPLPECSFAHLAPADVVALCGHFALPLPTPDVPLSTIAQDAGHTAVGMWQALADTRDVRLMIAAAALRGTVTKFSPDPRLNPLPYPKSPVKMPASIAAERPARAAMPPAQSAKIAGERRLAWVGPNPKSPKSESYARFALYEVGLTADELRARGLKPADLRWDSERGFIRWED